MYNVQPHKEPGKPVVGLTELKKDNAAKSWLFEKYYNMYFVDKNPEGDASADALSDEDEWENCIIRNIVWWRHRGYAVETALHGTPIVQSIERYQINSSLHAMIRDSEYNSRVMASRINTDPVEAETPDGCPV